MKKSNLRIGALFLVCAVLLCGCSPIVEELPETITVYASFYPIYALTESITRNVPDLDLRCLVQPQDGCFRSYSLSDWDLYLLGYSADALLMGGGGLENFSATINAAEDLAQSEVLHGLELYEGTSTLEEESHFSGENPHLYLSVDGGMKILENIAAAMSILDARYAEQYEANLTEALDEMERVKASIVEDSAHLAGQKVILMNEALIYAALDYGLEVDVWYERENGTALYSNEIQDCLTELAESDADVVLIERHAPEMLVAALENAGYSVAKLDVLTTRSADDGWNGYIEALTSNVEAVRIAFAQNEE